MSSHGRHWINRRTTSFHKRLAAAFRAVREQKGHSLDQAATEMGLFVGKAERPQKEIVFRLENPGKLRPIAHGKHTPTGRDRYAPVDSIEVIYRALKYMGASFDEIAELGEEKVSIAGLYAYHDALCEKMGVERYGHSTTLLGVSAVLMIEESKRNEDV